MATSREKFGVEDGQPFHTDPQRLARIKEKIQRDQIRGGLLRPLSAKARRIAGQLFDASPDIRNEVFKAFDR